MTHKIVLHIVRYTICLQHLPLPFCLPNRLDISKRAGLAKREKEEEQRNGKSLP
jgi:hypothetical protein